MGKGNGKGKGKGKETAVHHNPNPSSAGEFQKDKNLNYGKKKNPVVKVVLSHMHDYDKIKVYVDDEFGADKAFREAICRLRVKASEKKAVFHDIPCIGIVDDHSFPLMELQAIFEDKGGKVLISKKDFYVIAFHYRGRWFQLQNIDYDIYVDEEERCVTFEHPGSYGTAKPWEKIGPKSVIHAINTFNHPRAEHDDKVEACQVFFVHFCESSRLRLIEEIVCRSFGTLGYLKFDEVEDGDIYNALKAEWHINPTYLYDSEVEKDSISSLFSVGLNGYLAKIIHSWGQLSQWWIEYSLLQGTSGEGREGLMELESGYKMKYVKSVKAILGILYRPNRDKVISRLKGKVTQKELFEIEEKLKVLASLNKI